MKKIFFLLLCVIALPLKAQTWIEPEAEVQFQSAVINNEFEASSDAIATSFTIAGVRFAPFVGLRFAEQHRVMVGVSLFQDFGALNDKLSAQVSAWYQLDKKDFSFAMGIYPRTLLKGRYSTLILSDQTRFCNTLLGGFMLQWRPNESLYEIALDWNGKRGETRREEFNVVTSGHGVLTPWLSLNWEGMFHHYACSYLVWGVVDDIVFHPFASIDLTRYTGLQRLSFSAGAVIGYHCNRDASDRRLPVGANLVADIGHWGFGIRNTAYYGGSQAPFYGSLDASGEPFGCNLYMRNPQWQVTPEGGTGFYDKVDVYWAPKIGKAIEIRVRFSAHFGQYGFWGHQEILEAVLNLEQIRIHRKR